MAALRLDVWSPESLGFEVAAREPRADAAFLRLPRSGNHHDLGLFGIPDAAPRRPGVGLYHLAWQVDTIDELAEARGVLADAGALGGESSHGATKSVYGADPDGNEHGPCRPARPPGRDRALDRRAYRRPDRPPDGRRLTGRVGACLDRLRRALTPADGGPRDSSDAGYRGATTDERVEAKLDRLLLDRGLDPGEISRAVNERIARHHGRQS